jgi:hypothetical protein
MGSITMSVDTTVDVDIDMNKFNDDELIEEIEERGYQVFLKDAADFPLLNKYDCEAILNHIGWDAGPGSELAATLEKIRSLYYGR